MKEREREREREIDRERERERVNTTSVKSQVPVIATRDQNAGRRGESE